MQKKIITSNTIQLHLDLAQQHFLKTEIAYKQAKDNFMKYSHALEVIEELGTILSSKSLQHVEPDDIPHLHIIQQKILHLAKTQDVHKMRLIDIGKYIGEKHPQKVKHHLNQLKKKCLI